MENYINDLTQNLKSTNKKLSAENDALREENIKLKEHIKVLEKNEYIDELESNLKTLQNALQDERETQQSLKENVENLSHRLDEFLALFATYIDDGAQDIYKLNGDKSLMFGVNIDSAFLQSSPLKTICNYLNILKCTQIQHFAIDDFHTQKKSDIALIGEVFADFVRLANITKEAHIYGLVEIAMPDIINQNTITISFYGNKDVSGEFAQFREIYSKQLNVKESLRMEA
ncbi:hypothetical protein ACWIUD_00475 [Helicobacter sp. 23-1044]